MFNIPTYFTASFHLIVISNFSYLQSMSSYCLLSFLFVFIGHFIFFNVQLRCTNSAGFYYAMARVTQKVTLIYLFLLSYGTKRNPLSDTKEFGAWISMMKVKLTTIFVIATSHAPLGFFYYIKLCSFTIFSLSVMDHITRFTTALFPVPHIGPVTKIVKGLYFFTISTFY